MICPHCKEEISRVYGEGECWWKVYIDHEGNITDQDSVEEVTETLRYVCPECGVDIKDHIK